MQLSYTKEEWHQFVIMYIRDYLTTNNSFLDDKQLSDYDDAPWLYFLQEMTKRGVLAKLMSVKSEDNIKIFSDEKRMRNNINKTGHVVIIS